MRKQKNEYAPGQESWETPDDLVSSILEELPVPTQGHWCEPCAGTGQIIRAVNAHYGTKGPSWTAIELRHEHYAELRRQAVERLLPAGNYLLASGGVGCGLWDGVRCDVTIMHPPEHSAPRFVQKALVLSDWVLMLQRADWQDPALRATPPDRYLFDGPVQFMDGPALSPPVYYAWFVWPPVEQGRFRAEASTYTIPAS